MPQEPVTVIGATGALGFGLAVRLGGAGVPIIIGSRDARRRRRPASPALVPEGAFEGLQNEDAATRAELVVLSVPFRNQAENLTNLREHLTPANCCSTPRCRLPPPSP